MLAVKNLPANARDIRDAGSIPGWGRSPEGGHGNPLQYSCLENPMDREAWRATVHRVPLSKLEEVSLPQGEGAPCQGEKSTSGGLASGCLLVEASYREQPSLLHLIVSVPAAQELMGTKGSPGGASGKEPACQCRRHERHRFSPWVGKIS